MTWGLGQGRVKRSLSQQPAQEAPLPLRAAWLWNFHGDMYSVVQDSKSPSFLAARFKGHLTALSHFADEEMGPRSVNSISLQLGTDTEVEGKLIPHHRPSNTS